mgnify:CR=1 FL=1
MSTLRSKIIRLAYANPHLREPLLSVLAAHPSHLPSGDDLDGSREIGLAQGRKLEEEQTKELAHIMVEEGVSFALAVDHWLRGKNFTGPSGTKQDEDFSRNLMRKQLRKLERRTEALVDKLCADGDC